MKKPSEVIESEGYTGMQGSEMRLCKHKLPREGGISRPRSIPREVFLEGILAWHDPKKLQPSGVAAK